MLTFRTDLAAESHAFVCNGTENTTALQGVRARSETVYGCAVECVEILDDEGARILGKPKGIYYTLDYAGLRPGDGEGFSRAAHAAAQLLRTLLPREGAVLVAGLGNRNMTPDALGALTLEHLLVTRHLGKIFPQMRPVCAIGAGVLGLTGMEAAEWIHGAAQRVRPAAVVLVDALAARNTDRLCATIQISDSGLVPGSGIGNHRKALTRETLGVNIISVGVPTVVDAATLVRDMLEQCTGKLDAAALPQNGKTLFVTPDSIDARVRRAARLVACGLNLALQEGMELEDLIALTDP